MRKSNINHKVKQLLPIVSDIAAVRSYMDKRELLLTFNCTLNETINTLKDKGVNTQELVCVLDSGKMGITIEESVPGVVYFYLLTAKRVGTAIETGTPVAVMTINTKTADVSVRYT